MNRDTNIIARRIAREMVKATKLSTNKGGLEYFIGLGVALGIVWEIATNKQPGAANKMKPQEILEWAKGLPEERIIITN